MGEKESLPEPGRFFDEASLQALDRRWVKRVWSDPKSCNEFDTLESFRRFKRLPEFDQLELLAMRLRYMLAEIQDVTIDEI